MPRRLIQMGTTPTLVSYAKVRPEEGFVQGQPSEATVRVRTEAEPDGDFAAAEVDDLEAAVSVAGAKGATSFGVTLSSAVVKARRYLLELATGELFWVRALLNVAPAGGDAAEGTIEFQGISDDLTNGSTITLIDGLGQSKIFEFSNDGVVGAGNVEVPYSPGINSEDLATLLASIINGVGATLRMTAVGSPDGRVALTQTDAGTDGNTNINGTSLTAVALTNFSGGTNATKTFRTMNGLPAAVATSSTLFGVAIMRTLTADETADVGDALVDWTATIDGIEYEWTEKFHIVRRVPVWELDEDRLLGLWPEVLSVRPNEDVTLQETIDRALELELLPRLNARKVLEENIITPSVLTPAHLAAVQLVLAQGRDAKQDARAELEAKLDLAFRNPEGWFTATQDADPDVGGGDDEDFSSIPYGR